MVSKTVKKEAGIAALIVPTWINEENCTELIQKHVIGFKKIQNFEAGLCGGAGENYASIMLKIKATVELEDGSSKNIAYMIKTIPQSPQAGAMITMMGFFPKEVTMYNKHIPEFEHMYKIAGKSITFGPKSYRLANDPGADYVLLEDLSLKGFSNQNRLKGLDQEHTESVLELIAQFHAASAVRYETKGEYDSSFTSSYFSAVNTKDLAKMFENMQAIYLECLCTSKINAKYADQVIQFQKNAAENTTKYNSPILSDFNVINHGDLWSNNIMFRHNDDGKLIDTIFVDFQISKYGSPAIDLFYFLLSSTKLELKVAHFDEFIKYYHDHLVENLKMLHYPKEIPTLKQLHMDLLKYCYWAMQTLTTVAAPVLLDPTDNANIDNFIQQGEEGNKFKRQMYLNPRYIQHMETILPFLYMRGYLDE